MVGKLLSMKKEEVVVGTKVFKYKKDAQAWEAKTKNTLDEGKTLTRTKMTVREYLEHWHTNIIPTSDRDVSEYSYQRIRNQINNINSSIGHIKLRELKLLDVIGNDKSNPKIKGLRQKALERLSDQTVINMESCLKGAIDDGIARNFLAQNPLYKYRRHKKPIKDDDDKDVKFFTPQEQEKLLKTALDYSNGIRSRNFSEKRTKDIRWS